MDTVSEQDMAQRIFSEQVAQLYRNAPLGHVSTLINSLILVYVLWPVTPRPALFSWLALLWGVTALRYLGVRRFRGILDPVHQARPWARWFIVGMAASGLAWGSAVLIVFPREGFEYQVFIAFVLGGMSAGAASALSMLSTAAYAFILCAMTPLVLRLVYEGAPMQLNMALMLVLFAGMMLVFSRRTRDTFVESVRLRFEKSELMSVYARTRDQAERLSSSLEQASSERVRAEASLRSRETQLRTLVDNAPVILFAIDAEGLVTVFEGKALAVLDVGPGAWVGRSIFECYRDEPQMIYTLRKALAGEQGSCIIDVHDRHFEVRCAPLYDAHGAVIGAVGVQSDITEKVSMEGMKRDFISTVSHELRTPLTSIVGALELIDSDRFGADAAQTQNLLDMARRNSRRLISLVNDILDMDKLALGHMQYHRGPLVLKDLLAQALHDNAAYAAHYDIALELADPMPDLRVMADEDRILQVLANLLSNAVKHSPRGETVSLVAQAEDGAGFARISVIDHGPGVSERDRAHIFEKFAQVSDEHRRVYGGSGLGLSIAKAIVEQHGGHMGLEVEEKNTCFYFTLPLSEGAV